jgi:ABC-type nitrate/sulfonate/bicarbonate transport system permease component
VTTSSSTPLEFYEPGVPGPAAGGPGRWTRTVVGAFGILLAALAWEGAIEFGVIDSSVVPPLTEVFDALGEELGSDAFWIAAWRTAESTLLGLAISVAIALPLGVALGLSRRAFRSTRFLVEFLKPIPVVAILPLVLLIYGTTLEMKLVLITFGTLWPLLIHVLYGVQSVDPVVASTARAFRLNLPQRLLRVVLPSAAPMIATGLRVSAVTALILSIVTELVGGAQGLGFEITRAQLGGNYARMYALVLVTGVIGLALNAALERPERRLLHWHAAYRGEAGA